MLLPGGQQQPTSFEIGGPTDGRMTALVCIGLTTWYGTGFLQPTLPLSTSTEHGYSSSNTLSLTYLDGTQFLQILTAPTHRGYALRYTIRLVTRCRSHYIMMLNEEVPRDEGYTKWGLYNDAGSMLEVTQLMTRYMMRLQDEGYTIRVPRVAVLIRTFLFLSFLLVTTPSYGRFPVYFPLVPPKYLSP